MRTGRRVALAAGLSIGLATAAYGAPGRDALAVGFEAEAVVVSGAAPGGQVVVFGVAREVADYAETLVRREAVVTADATGAARYEIGRAVAPQSVWVAVDLATGGTAAAAPAGFELVERDFRGRGVLRGLLSDADGLEDARPFLEVLLVRPGAVGGAWGASVGDGGAADEDGAGDGKLRVSLARLRPVGSSGAAPERFAPGDTVAAIEPRSLQLTLVTLQGGRP